MQLGNNTRKRIRKNCNLLFCCILPRDKEVCGGLVTSLTADARETKRSCVVILRQVRPYCVGIKFIRYNKKKTF